jgi:hypothetical protein
MTTLIPDLHGAGCGKLSTKSAASSSSAGWVLVTIIWPSGSPASRIIRSLKRSAAPYRDAVKLWEARALVHVNRKIGYVPGTIEHRWHGDKTRRAYVSRWDMFIKHQFNPLADLKRNSYGVLEFSGNKPELERMFGNYLRDREEDSNILG